MEEEVILNKIIEEARQEADSVIAEATKKAKKIEEENRQNAAKQAQEQFDIMKKKITLEANSEIERAEFDARNKELTEKKRIIEIVKEKVKQKIRDLDEDTYVNLIDEKIKKYKDIENVELLLPEKCYEEVKKLGLSYGMKVLAKTDEFKSGVIVKIRKIRV